jgi:hypothetical protein
VGPWRFEEEYVYQATTSTGLSIGGVKLAG